MIPLCIPNLGIKEKEYLDNCIDTTFVSSVGEYVTRFENMCATSCGAKYAVATSSGTTGLHAALTAAGVKYGDLVILPTYTFIASANAIAHCGGVPWLFDICDDWTIDANAVDRALTAECHISDEGKVIHTASGRRVAAIMPVYTLGNIPDMLMIRDIATRYGLPVIADAACAIGAEPVQGNLAGLADFTVFSFNGNKTVTCGGGGAIAGNDKTQMDLVRHLTTTARVGKEYDFDMVGFNYRMTNIQAAVGCAQMERRADFVERKRNIRREYRNRLSDIAGIGFFPETVGSSCWFSGIVLEEGRHIEDVRIFCAELKNAEIEAKPFWKPIHLQQPYRSACINGCALADTIWDRIITLPCSTGITEEELGRVCDEVHSILRK